MIFCGLIIKFWKINETDEDFLNELVTKLLYHSHLVDTCRHEEFRDITNDIKNEYPKLSKLMDAIRIYNKLFRLTDGCVIGTSHTEMTMCYFNLYRVSNNKEYTRSLILRTLNKRIRICVGLLQNKNVDKNTTAINVVLNKLPYNNVDLVNIFNELEDIVVYLGVDKNVRYNRVSRKHHFTSRAIYNDRSVQH
jgi:hypothetical protein